MEILGLFEGSLIRLAAGFAAGFMVAWFIPSPASLVKFLGKKKD
tara:strand:- start:307 stop:438 length:132 start_codon:yes stop_codon:yes gene_type:complete